LRRLPLKTNEIIAADKSLHLTLHLGRVVERQWLELKRQFATIATGAFIWLGWLLFPGPWQCN